MPRNIEPIHARRAAQLKALAQVRNTLPRGDRQSVAELYDACSTGNGQLSTENLQDWQLELIDRIARAHLREVA